LSQIKLFSDLYLVKLLDISAKPFFLCVIIIPFIDLEKTRIVRIGKSQL